MERKPMNQMLQMRNKFAPNIPKVQCRRMPITVDNLRSVGKSESGNVVISGYAVKWDSINYFGEKFVKGAFTDVCARFANKSQKIHAYYNHGWRMWFVDSHMTMRVGKYLQIKEDDTGLFIELEFTKGLPIAEWTAAMVQHGTVDGFSIAFYPPKDSDIIDKGAYIEILKADIYEISVVDEPADEAARVINNETIDSLETIDDAESLLRSILPGGYGEKLLSRLADIQKPVEKPNPKPDPFAFLDERKN